MKKFLFLFLFCLTVTLLAQTTVSKVERLYHTNRHIPPYGRAEYYEIKNSLNTYLIYFQWILQDEKHDSTVVIGLPEPEFLNGWRNRDFMSFQVDNISSALVEPRNFRIENNTLLVEYNFDGSQFSLRFFMTQNSPLLNIELTRNPNSKGCTKLGISFVANPSRASGKANEFSREIISSERSLVQPPKTRGTFKLSNKDRYFVLSDNFYDFGPNDSISHGPCFFKLDWKNVIDGEVYFGNINNVAFKFVLNPQAKKWNFSVLEFRRKYSNQDYLRYLQSIGEFSKK